MAPPFLGDQWKNVARTLGNDSIGSELPSFSFVRQLPHRCAVAPIAGHHFASLSPSSFFIVFSSSSSSSSSSFSWKSTRPGGTVTKPSLKKKEQKWNTVCVCYQVAMMKYSSALPHLGVAFLCDLMARSCNCGPPPPPPGQTDSLHSSENVFFFQTTFLFALHLLFYRQQQPQQQQQQPKKKSLSLGVSIGFEVASSLK